MTKHISSKVYDHFESCSSILTSSSDQYGADLLYAPFINGSNVTKLCSSILSDGELLRADRFVSQAEKEQFIQRRAFRRFCGAKLANIALPLSQIVFEETKNGRPYLAELPDFWFSFSSSKIGFLGGQSSTHCIGVDLEVKARNLEATALAHHFFSKNEACLIEQAGEPARSQLFLKLWCLKEAALKSIGEGLPFGLDVFQFELEPVLQVIHAPAEHGGQEYFSAHLVETVNFNAALVLHKFSSKQ